MQNHSDCFEKVKKKCFHFISSQETKKEKFKNKEKMIKSFLIPICFWINKSNSYQFRIKKIESNFLSKELSDRLIIGEQIFSGEVKANEHERIEWAIAWPADNDDGFSNTYCNTIPTISGGSHESGLRAALMKSIRAYAELSGIAKRISQLTADDIMIGACVSLSIFMRDPQFQGQTKERLVSPEASKLVEQSIKDRFDHWLSGSPETTNLLINSFLERSDYRLRRKQEKEVSRKSATRKLRLPGKLTDCSKSGSENTEIFIVEGDSAGGSATVSYTHLTLPTKRIV